MSTRGSDQDDQDYRDFQIAVKRIMPIIPPEVRAKLERSHVRVAYSDVMVEIGQLMKLDPAAVVASFEPDELETRLRDVDRLLERRDRLEAERKKASAGIRVIHRRG